MVDMLAIVSKAQFETAHGKAKLGDVLALESYVSTSRALAPLVEGGDLYLVTVRPKDVLWLVGVLERPSFDGARWHAQPSRVRIVDISCLKDKLVFSTGKGLGGKPGSLGMSLQTPRRLAEADVVLLQAALDARTSKGQRSEPRPGQPAQPKPQHRPASAATVGGRAPATATTSVAVNLALIKPGLVTRPGPAALEAQVASEPNDLDARRVLSDALLERGDPRGEYIRLALLAAELDEWDPDFESVTRALNTLEACYGKLWAASLHQFAELAGSGKDSREMPYWYGRGVVEGLRAQPKALGSLLARLRSVVPITRLELLESSPQAFMKLAQQPDMSRVQHLSLLFDQSAEERSIPGLFESEALESLKSLKVGGYLPENLAEQLATAPFAESLRELRLVGRGAMGAKGLARLLDSPLAKGLTELHLDHQDLRGAIGELVPRFESLTALCLERDQASPKALRALFESERLGGLRQLRLDSVPVGDQLQTLASSQLSGLRQLVLRRARLNPERLAAALKCWNLPQLRMLDLGYNPLREAGAKVLARSTELNEVVQLQLAGCGLGDSGAAQLAEARGLCMRELDLANNGITAQGMAALAKGPCLASVRVIHLQRNKCKNAGGLALAEWAALPQLHSLSLSYNWMGVAGLRAMVERMQAIQGLHLGENNYSVEPARALANSENIRDLRRLSLCGADERWMLALAQSAAVRRLESLRLSDCWLDEAGAKALTELPCLGRVHLSYSRLSREGHELLSERFGPGLTCVHVSPAS